ncbi:hypothetical protein MLD52_14085 [Puniceicoccaceae bacterium K14]|nr:hypothetical protein [Puniceicoccaceae bacterium K14]
MESSLPVYIQALVYSFIGLSILTSILKSRSISPQLGILNRWLRWFGISLGLAYLIHESSFSSRPYWTLAVICFLSWLLLETLYNWIAITALSRSNFNLFPYFRENRTGEEWPADPKVISIRDWLRENGFKKMQALVADLGNDMTLRSSVYQSSDDTVRVQILFLPQTNGYISNSISFYSESESGDWVVTDNQFIPFGGFYPDNWDLSRHPWTRKIDNLFFKHCKRVDDEGLINFDDTPIDMLNDHQKALENTNLELGFLVPRHLQEDHGRISWEGRYRVWKEVWLLNYLGISSKH